LLRVIAGLAAKFAGTILLSGQTIDTLAPDARVRCGLRSLPQDHRVFRTLTVEDNVRLGVRGQSAGDHISRPNLNPPGSRDGLGNSWLNVMNRQVGLLSGGEQARLALELLHWGTLEVVLLDEPTNGIDSLGVEQLKAEILSWSADGKAVVIVEHNIAFIRMVASRVAVMKDATLREIVAPTPVALNRALFESDMAP
jgi:ABC-type branched-subunit amino acid transport system ATPase component